MAFGEATQGVRQKLQGVIVRGAEADDAADCGGFEGGPDTVVNCEHLAGAAEQEYAVGRQLDGFAAASGEEDFAELGFEFLHLHGDGGLGAADALAGAGEAAIFSYEDEGAKEFGVQAGREGHGDKLS